MCHSIAKYSLIASCLSHVIKDKDRIRKRLAQWNNVAVIGKYNITDFLANKFAKYWLLQQFRVHILELYAVRIFQQIYQHVHLAAI